MKSKLSPVFVLFFVVLQLPACKKDKSEAPPPAPIAIYKFDNDYLTNSVSSYLDGTGVDNLASTTDSFNTAFGALLFTGDGYVRVKDSDLIDFPGSQFTIAAWIRPTKTQTVYIIIKSEDGNNLSPYSLDIHPGFLRAFVRTTTDEQFLVTGTTPIQKNVWQHIAATLNGEQLTIYLNGKSEGSVAVDRPLQTTTGNLAIGTSEKHYPSTCFTGKMDNVVIYDKGLTAGQVKNLFEHYNQ